MTDMFDAGYDLLFFAVFAFIIITFLLIFGLILYNAIRYARQTDKNNRSPELTVDAVIVAKRTSCHSHHEHAIQHGTLHDSVTPGNSSTFFYITFEVQSCDRIELLVPDQDFGMLTEGDAGKLTFQGTRFLDFEKI